MKARLDTTFGALRPECSATKSDAISGLTFATVNVSHAMAHAHLAAGKASSDGNPERLADFLSLLDTFEFWFNIVTP